MKISAAFTPTKWDEVNYGPVLTGTKTTKASIEYTFSDVIAGTAQVEYLMFYSAFDPADMHVAEAEFIGLAQFSGTIEGRTGTFTLQEIGTFSGGMVSSTLRVLAGSGIGELKGISGTGAATADSKAAQWTLDLTFLDLP